MSLPDYEQIQRAAYTRWERRGYQHGRDREDWSLAEQALLFGLNYEVAANYPASSSGEQVLGNRSRPVCRFCERAAPATTFHRLAPAAPECLGPVTLLSAELCDECRGTFAEGIDQDLARFVASAGGDRRPGDRPLCIPAAALKGFARVALAIMPRGDLDAFEDTIEWVGNPDHEFDRGLLGDLSGFVHLREEAGPSAEPWLALARRTDDQAPMPYLILFAATPDVVFEVPVPLCSRDEDLDGEAVVVPRVCSPWTEEPGCGQGPCVSLPIWSLDPRRAAVSC